MKVFLFITALLAIGGVYMIAHYIIPDYHTDLAEMKHYTKIVKQTRMMRVKNANHDDFIRDSVDVPVVDLTDGSFLVFSGDAQKFWPEIKEKAQYGSKITYYPRAHGNLEYNPLQVEIDGKTIYSRNDLRSAAIPFVLVALLPTFVLIVFLIYYLKKTKLR